MKIELDDRGPGVTARPLTGEPLTEPLTCHGTPIGTLKCQPTVWTSDSEFTGYAMVRCPACGTRGKMAWGIAIPGATDEEIDAAMRERAVDYWNTKPTQTYGDL